MLPPGIRVVRGPHWIWQNQDGGEGHVGTVCEIGRFGSAHSPEKTVVVNWDSGHRTNYRVGYQGQYDLIIVDNAQVGVRHSNVVCDGCMKGGIAGIVFKCAQCPNYHLCASCYGADVHEIEHSFIRFTTPTSLGVRVPPRKGSVKLQLKGIFVGAKVVRGPDWEWGQQDGGEGKTGRVIEIRGWDNESCRSVANVSWVSGSTNVYRLGHKGNVDLKYVVPTVGGYYYKEHMPILGQPEEQQPVVPTVKPSFSVGDRVKVCLEVDALMKLQQGHGGWNPRMVEHLSKLGTVHRITEKGDVRVQYENCPNRWTFHPAALVKVCSFRVGDLVTIINDLAKVQQLQKGHGEWIEPMKNALGKICKVIKVYSDGDLRIQQLEEGFEWTLNPKCVKLERSPLATAAERSNSMMDLSHQRTDHVMTPLSGLSGTSLVDKLVREAAQGHLDYVKQYLDQHPSQVDVMSGGKTCLQVAAHQGHVNLVRYLLGIGANVNIVDKEGDSTLHYAAFGNQPETMKILLQHGADSNFLNASHCSALHICAHKKTPHCVRVLLEFGADVNIQDSYGDTALHDAIGKENTEVVELLCNAPNLDFTVRNNRGFNVLHHASLKGNVTAAKRILQLARQLVNVKKDDGFAALHLAALNGHAKVVETLVIDGQAEIDIRNNRRQTPFLLAVSQGHSAAIEKLVSLGCDILAKDEDGDNAMHLCVIKKTNFLQASPPPQDAAPGILEIYQNLSHLGEHRLMYTILCYLVKKGCRIEANNKGAKILDWITDKDMQDLIISYQNNGGGGGGETSNNGIGDGNNMIENHETTINEIHSSNTNDLARNVSDGIHALNLNSANDENSGNNGSNGDSLSLLSNNQFNSNITTTQGTTSKENNLPPPLPPPSSSSNHHQPQQQQQQHISEEINTQSSMPIISKKLNSDFTSSSNTKNNSPYVEMSLNNKANTITANLPNSNHHHHSLIHHHHHDQASSYNSSLPPPPQSSSSSSSSSRHVSRKQLNNVIVMNNSSNIGGGNSNSINNIQPLSIQKAQNISKIQECIVCDEILQLITFEPCQHQISCEDCGLRMKKCLSCGVLIEKRIGLNGRLIQSKDHNRLPSVDRLRYLESKIQEYEESHYCSICMERSRDVAFLCGHGSCSRCAETLRTCHMCRKTIVKKINLY